MQYVCPTIVHCFLLMVLLATHWSYGLIVQPQYSSVLDSRLQNGNATCSMPFNAFLTRHIAWAFLSCHAFHIFCILSVQVLQCIWLICLPISCVLCLSCRHALMLLGNLLLPCINFLCCLCSMISS